MITHDQFLRDVESFLSASGTPATKLGREAIGDPNFVGDLRAGRIPSLKTADRVLSFIAKKSKGAAHPGLRKVGGHSTQAGI